MDDLITIFESNDVAEAMMLKAELKQVGINALMQPIARLGDRTYTVQVLTDRVERAAIVVAKFRHEELQNDDGAKESFEAPPAETPLRVRMLQTAAVFLFGLILVIILINLDKLKAMFQSN